MPDMAVSTKQAVSGEVRAHAARRNLTQRQLAAEIGMPPSTLSRRMVGEQAWDLDDLDVLAEFFGIAVRDLIPEKAADPEVAT